jgi:enoyl-[acyl-carrier protein] reductase I
MQNLFNDGGFSSMGMSLLALQQYEKGLHEDCDCGPAANDHLFD